MHNASGPLFSLLIAIAAATSCAMADQPASSPTSPAAAARESRIQRQLASKPGALPTLADATLGLPNIDVRFNADGSVAPFVVASIDALKQSPAWRERIAAAAALRSSLPELTIDDDALLATPRFVRSTRALLTPPPDDQHPKREAQDLVARFIADHRALFEIDPLEIPAARPSRDFLTTHNGARHLTFQQQLSVRGRAVDLVGCEVRANITRANQLINISSTMIPRPAAGFIVPSPTLSAAEALAAAARDIGITLSTNPQPLAPAANPDDETTRWHPFPELRSTEPLTTMPVCFPLTRTDIHPAYIVSLAPRGIGHTYDLIIDALTGATLSRHNRLVWDTTEPAQYRVFTGESPAPNIPGRPTPDGFQAPFVTRDLVTIEPSAISAINPNGWVPDGSLQTLGNNVQAHLDLDANDSPDLPRPAATLVGNTRVFDFPLDPAQAPATYRNAAVVQLFYWGNLYHDILHNLGFDEPAGNFQTSNFSRGGTSGDAITADAQDGNGLGGRVNNANFNSSGVDGSNARIQMYLFDGPDPDRDSSLDGLTVFHEFTHGTSIRLHGGLTSSQSRGLGEGWSDFYALALFSRPTDNPNAPYAFGSYSTYQFFSPEFIDNSYYGIRRFPYCTNPNINPLTFADIDPAQMSFPPGVLRNLLHANVANEVHNIGEVWCNILWECRAALWAVHGPSANQLMLQLATDAMKLSPANPTFTQARDAIIQADLVNSSGANHRPLWRAFAKRGLGFGAIAPIASSATGVVESYETPFFARFDFPNGLPSTLQPGFTTPLRVNITGIDLDILPESPRLFVSANFAPATSWLLTLIAPGQYLAHIPPQQCLSSLRYWFSVETTEGPRLHPGSGSYSASINSGSSIVFTDSFELDTGWSVGPNTASSGLWLRADPIGTSAQPDDDHTTAPGTLCWITGNAPIGASIGAADVDNGFTTLLSPSFNLSSAGDVRISYWRWYSSGLGAGAFADTFRVDVSTDNSASWTNAETIGPDESPDTTPGWRFASWSLRQLGLVPTSTVRIRFTAEDVGVASVVEAAIDDFTIEALLCTTAPSCLADINSDSALSPQDIFEFLTAFFANSSAADLNASGDVTLQDIFDFLTSYFSGC